MDFPVNKELTDNVQQIRKHYLESIPADSGVFSVIVAPFQVVKFKNVLSFSSCQKEILDSMGKLNFHRKDNDLYSFWQTDDLHTCSLKPIKKFINTLTNKIAPILSSICDVQFSKRLDITASLYEYKDVLLCHDDKCGDRCIAFVYYLTEADECGGTFDMFDHDGGPDNIECHVLKIHTTEGDVKVRKEDYETTRAITTGYSSRSTYNKSIKLITSEINSYGNLDDGIWLATAIEVTGDVKKNQPTDVKYSLPPEKNSLVFFEVGNLTYHQVSEVTDEKFQRYSINGWFHSKKKQQGLKYREPLPPMHQQIALKGLVLLEKFVNILYCTPSRLIEIQEHFEEESFVLLKTIFLKKFFNLCSVDVKRNCINWKKKGPANRRNYEVADLKSLPKSIKSLIKFLMSTLFVSFLKNITGLSLKPCTGYKSSSEFSLELIRWCPGCYMMATDNDAFFERSGLDLYLYFCSDDSLTQPENSSGYVTYLATDDDNCSEKELITIVPEDNALALVYRTEETVRFTKYINHSVKKEYYGIYATYYEHESLDDR